MGLEEQIPAGIVLTSVEKIANFAGENSMFSVTFGLACCAIEMMSTTSGRYDLARFGMEVFRASPRQADLMIVPGRLSQKMAPVLRQVYDQMAAWGDGAHQLVEIGKAPVADAGLFIGRDVGGIHLADRRFHAQAAGERLAFRAGRMAGNAVAGAGQVFALAYQLGVRGGAASGHRGAGNKR